MNCYIHIPFCVSKCGYCAFYSEAGASSERADIFLDKLSQLIVPERLETLYLGGGTPTCLNEKQLERLIGILKNKFDFTDGAEISIEANPETLTEKKVTLLRGFFTRISLGIQSFDPELRHKIGRRCTEQALKRAIDLIKDAHFPHWNCDLIYSLPDESLNNWEEDLHKAGSLGCDHVSCYSLTPERAALMGNEFSEDDENGRIMYETAGRILATYGIKRYEISNYAVAGGECRHNLNVWRGERLRGYGPSAADFDGIDRHIEVESLDRWLAGESPETDRISPESRRNEIFAVNLRTVNGWSREMWEQLPGADSWNDRLQRAGQVSLSYPGMLQITPLQISLSPEGLLFWNDIAAEFL